MGRHWRYWKRGKTGAGAEVKSHCWEHSIGLTKRTCNMETYMSHISNFRLERYAGPTEPSRYVLDLKKKGNNGTFADVATKYSWECKRPPKMGFPHFLLAYFLKVNEPQRHFSSGILHKRHYEIKLEVLRRAPAYSSTSKRCQICTTEKLFIATANPEYSAQ